jgi:hypothetical protein
MDLANKIPLKATDEFKLTAHIGGSSSHYECFELKDLNKSSF